MNERHQWWLILMVFTEWTNVFCPFLQASPFAFSPASSTAVELVEQTHGPTLLNMSVGDQPTTTVSQPAGQEGRRPSLPDKRTVGRHFQLTAATWTGIIWRISAKCWVNLNGPTGSNPREWDQRGDGEQSVAIRSTSTDLWLSAFKALAVPGQSFWSQREDRVERFKCWNKAQRDRWHTVLFGL